MKYPDHSSIISDGKTTDRLVQSITLDAPYGLLVFLAQSRRYSTRRLNRAEALLRLLQRYVNSQLASNHAYNIVSFQTLPTNRDGNALQSASPSSSFRRST